MKVFGLIGYPLGHSFSQTYFTDKFKREGLGDYRYENFPLEEIDQLPELIQSQKELCGLNVTIPYKQQVLPMLDEIDSQAEEIGAVNTIKINRQGKNINIRGFNTDVYGFEEPLLEVLKPHHTKALILGTGGASRAVNYILKKHNIKGQWVSRNPSRSDVLSYSQLTPEIIAESKVIINCSPLGMHPQTDQCPNIPYQAISDDHILYDLIYNPEKTLFLKKGEEKKATLINGLPMLHIQAEKSWTIWNSKD